MGKKVNVVLWDGTVRSVDEDTAKTLSPTNRRETDQEGQDRALNQVNAERTAGTQEALKTAAEGILDATTAGIFGKAVGALDPEWAQNMQLRGQQHSTARLGGELLGYANPIGGAGSLAEHAGAGIAARTGSKALGRLGEGAILGGIGSVVQTNVTGDELTIAGTLEEAGLGAVLNYGIGAMSDKLFGAGKRAAAKLAEGDRIAATKKLAETGEGLLAKTESYSGFKGAHDDAVKAARANNTAAEREAKAVKNAANPANMKRAIDVVKKSRAEVQAALADDPIARVTKATEKANAKAEADYAEQVSKRDGDHSKATEAYEKFRDSTDLNKQFTQVDDAINKLKDRPGGRDPVSTPKEAGVPKEKAWTGPGNDRPPVLLSEEGGDFADTKRLPRGQHIDHGAPSGLGPTELPGGDFPSSAKGAVQNGSDFSAGVRGAAPGAHGAPEFPSGDFPANVRGAARGGDFSADVRGAAAPKGGDFPSDIRNAARGGEFPESVISGAPSDHPDPLAGKAPKKPLNERIREFERRRSMASQKLGSWDAKAERWTENAGKSADRTAAMEELRQLQNDIIKEFPTGKHVKGLKDMPPPPGVKAEIPAPVKKVVDKSGITAEDELIRMQLIQHSRDLTQTITDATEKLKAGDYEGVMDSIRGAEARARQAGAGDMVFPKLPEPPRPTVPVSDVKLPKDLESFVRMRPETVERLAQHVEGMDQGVQDSFMSILHELDLEPAGSIGDTIRATHANLRKYVEAIDELEGAGISRVKKRKGFLAKVGDASKGAVRYAAQRGVDVGGWRGAVLRTLVGAGVGHALDGAEGAMMGAALMQGRLGVRSKLTELVAKVAPKAGRALAGLAPITAYLASSFPTGSPDHGDIQDLAHRRLGDIAHLAQVAPDASYTAFSDFLGHPGDVAYKLHAYTLNAVNYLHQTMPKDPGLDVSLNGSNWRPSMEQSLALAHRIEAVCDPLTSIRRSVQGDGHPAAIEALWACHAPLMAEYAQEFMLTDRSSMTYEAESRMAALLRVDTGLRKPEVLASIQGMYLPAPQQPQGGGKSSPGTPGRPAAVSNPVAGSSVAALTSQ